MLQCNYEFLWFGNLEIAGAYVSADCLKPSPFYFGDTLNISRIVEILLVSLISSTRIPE